VQLKNQVQEIKEENVQLKNQVQEIKNENEEIKEENAQLKNQVQEFKNEKLTQTVQQQNKEIENLKILSPKPLQVNLTETNGIISHLKKNDRKPVWLTSSSHDHPVFIPENVLEVYDNYWHSKNIPNSWIKFNFKNTKIAPSKYLIRNGSRCWEYSPQGWKLEGSNDGSNWETIHEVRDCEIFRKKNQEASFSCETSQFFSFLRFTQTQENLLKFHNPKYSNHSFLLNFVEFSGKIISNE
jgi:hypothetical protein